MIFCLTIFQIMIFRFEYFFLNKSVFHNFTRENIFVYKKKKEKGSIEIMRPMEEIFTLIYLYLYII